MTPRTPQPRRRGTSLIEAVAVVLVLAICVPPTIAWMMSGAQRRDDAVRIIRATTLAQAVMEQVLCDASNTDVGAAPAAYLDTAVTGLRARLSSVASIYTGAGFSYDVAFGPLSDASLTVTGAPAADLYRTVTVTVSYTSARGAAVSIPVSGVVAKP